ncbi:probable chitinase 2 [Halyomorpha halys]|uniref:probable chitinase 2 n=1 Tax=Halyomorpha halys TaxID=286706 RepID=UPI0006D50BAB|nr:probable chitinase 2 [Halyomorpha halys]
MSWICFLASLVVLVSAAPKNNGRGVVVCYVGTWAAYRPMRGQFSVEDLRPDLCTHIVYSFAGLNATSWTIKSLDPHLDLEENYGKGWYKKVTGLKKEYPDLKVTLAIGGWNEGSGNYSALAADPEKRRPFIASVLRFLKDYDFDGLDLDWEFPTQRGGAPEDKENFIILIKELRSALTVGGYILTAAISASIDTLASGYDLPRVSDNLDLVHMMAYDYHGSWEKFTAPNAPLFPPSDKLTLSASLEYVLRNGIKAEKLVVGVPMYGRTFVLESPSRGVLGETSLTTQGFQGPFTRTDGFLGYHEICNELRTGNWTVHWDNTSLTPFATTGNRLITYDNPESIMHKVKYAMGQGVAGIMTWSVDTDDFRGDCALPGQTSPRDPLLQAIMIAIEESLYKKPTTPPPKQPEKPEPSSAVQHCLYPSLYIVLALISYIFY